MAELERASDADQVVPVLVDQVDLGVVGEEGAGFRPGAVVAGGVGSPEPFLSELGDPGRQAQTDEIEEGEGGQGLYVDKSRGVPVSLWMIVRFGLAEIGEQALQAAGDGGVAFGLAGPASVLGVADELLLDVDAGS